MKLLKEWNHILNSCLDSTLLLAGALSLGLIASYCSVTHQHVELSDLVGVLAWSGNLDWPCPVEVTMAEREGELLDLDLFQGAFVEGDKAVSSQDTTLVSRGRSDEEVKWLRRICLTTFVLDQTTIDDTTAWRVVQLAT